MQHKQVESQEFWSQCLDGHWAEELKGTSPISRVWYHIKKKQNRAEDPGKIELPGKIASRRKGKHASNSKRRERHHYEIQGRECFSGSVDHHPRGDLSADIGGKLRVLLSGRSLPAGNVWLQTPVEVVAAHAGVDDGDQDQDERDDGEERHRCLRW